MLITDQVCAEDEGASWELDEIAVIAARLRQRMDAEIERVSMGTLGPVTRPISLVAEGGVVYAWRIGEEAWHLTDAGEQHPELAPEVRRYNRLLPPKPSGDVLADVCALGRWVQAMKESVREAEAGVGALGG